MPPQYRSILMSPEEKAAQADAIQEHRRKRARAHRRRIEEEHQRDIEWLDHLGAALAGRSMDRGNPVEVRTPATSPATVPRDRDELEWLTENLNKFGVNITVDELAKLDANEYAVLKKLRDSPFRQETQWDRVSLGHELPNSVKCRF